MSDYETFWVCVAFLLFGCKFVSAYFSYKKEQVRIQNNITKVEETDNE